MDQSNTDQGGGFTPTQSSNQTLHEEEKKTAVKIQSNSIGILQFESQKEYTQKNVLTRWEEERAKWLKVPESQSKVIIHPKVKQMNEEVTDRCDLSKVQGGTSLAQFINKRDYNAEQQAKTFQNDVRGDIQSRDLPDEDSDSERRAVRKIMKAQSGPYQKFDAYYALEDIIDLYMEIWYDSDSSSN